MKMENEWERREIEMSKTMRKNMKGKNRRKNEKMRKNED